MPKNQNQSSSTDTEVSRNALRQYDGTVCTDKGGKSLPKPCDHQVCCQTGLARGAIETVPSGGHGFATIASGCNTAATGLDVHSVRTLQ
jgi:hypothetical protein